MTIVHVVHAFLPHHRHGAELSTLELARAQVRDGHRVVIFAGESGRNLRELTIRREDYEDLEVWRVHFAPRSRNGFLRHERLERELRVRFASLAPDIVHIQDLTTLSLSVIHAARDSGAPVLFTLRNYTLLCARRDLVRGDGSTCLESDLVQDCVECLQTQRPGDRSVQLRAAVEVALHNLGSVRSWRLVLERALGKLTGEQPKLSLRNAKEMRQRNTALHAALERVQVIHAQNEDFARRFEQFADLPTGRLTVVQHTRDLASFTFRRRTPPAKPMIVGYVGKIAPHKGLHVLIDALRGLPSGSVRLEVYGSPGWTSVAEVAYLLQQKRSAGSLDVHFHSDGFGRDEAASVYDRFDVLVMPSVWPDCNPGVILEAQASGAPVVTSDVGGGSVLVRDG